MVDIDPKAANLFFLEDPISQRKAAAKVPFDWKKSDLNPPYLVEIQGDYFIFNGNHRFYAARQLDAFPPTTISAQLFTTAEFATYTGLSQQDILHYTGRATQHPALGP